MRVLYAGPVGARTGFAVAAQDYCSALLRAGVALDIQPLLSFEAEDLDDDGYGHLLPHVLGHPDHVDLGDPDRIIIHTVPAMAATIARDYPGEVPRILITTWETSRLPDELRLEIGAEFDRVVVPSEFCREVMRETGPSQGTREGCRAPSGATIEVVPHCFDPARQFWRPEVPGWEQGEPYTFGWNGVWSERKNPIGVLKAFYSEFSATENVALLMKTPGYSDDDITALRGALGYRDYNENVEVVTGHYDDIAEFYDHVDCLVSASRGEGWNLPAFEAALAGLPVIAPTWGGQYDFLSDYPNAHLYGGQLTPAISPPVVDAAVDVGAGVHVRPVKRVQPSGVNARQLWFEPNLVALRGLMRDAYEQRWRVHHCGRERLEERYSYDVVGKMLANVIETTRRTG